jgi:hypothetical protein
VGTICCRGINEQIWLVSPFFVLSAWHVVFLFKFVV